MPANRHLPKVGLIWAQFSAYHVDRLEAAGKRLQGRARVFAIEVASASHTYSWEESGTVRFTEKVRLFERRRYEDVPAVRRFWRQLKTLSQCDTIFVGVPYSAPDMIALSWLLRAMGKTVVMMTASKFDDFSRSAARELCKKLILLPYNAAIVGGSRQHDYVRYLGFSRRRVLPGYNTVSMDRVRQQAANAGTGQTAFENRSFIYVGRFVTKKNLEVLLDGYARYARHAGAGARRLSLVGDGPLKEQLAGQCRDLGIDHLVDFKGFLTAPEVSAELANSLALVLVSTEEQWGLVVNEALAVALPIIASAEIGAREALVRNLVNGYVVESRSPEVIAEAMVRMDAPEAEWLAMSAASRDRAWLADAERFADAVELMVFPQSEETARTHLDFAANILIGQ